MRTPKISEAAIPVRAAAQKGNWTCGESGEFGAGDEGGCVGADAEEGDVSEVEESGEADDDVEAEGDGSEDEDADAEVGVGVLGLGEGEDRGGEEGHGGGESLVPCVELGEAVGESGAEEGPGVEEDEEDECEEDLGLFVGDVDAVGEDGQAECGGGGDDDALCPGGQALGCGDAFGFGEVVLGGGAGAGECEGSGEGERGACDGDPAAGVDVDESAEFEGDGEDDVPGGGEGGECGEEHGGGGGAGVEPAQSAGVLVAEQVEEGDDARR